jgi:precorrin-2 dehydrogenase/sirohydrochlorin ferrochelatase/precorrin-6A/cobalt-precorrin-6A reductase
MRILLFGGTTEGREIAREIAKSGRPLLYSVVTEYGEKLASNLGNNVETRVGRMNAEEMRKLFLGGDIAGVIDATHPHAVEVSQNARLACERTLVPYVRVVREAVTIDSQRIMAVTSCEEAAELLNTRWSGAKVLLTAGSKELERFASVADYRRLYVRVLPIAPTIEICEKLGFDAGHIIAMKGPFSKAMNVAMLEMTGARVLVTKDSGPEGGLPEKLGAAQELGVEVILIRRSIETGVTAQEAIEWGRCLMRGIRPFPMFPLFTNIAYRGVVVVGGGAVALRRVKTLLTCGARIKIVSPSFDATFDDPAFRNIERISRSYEDGDLERAFLAVAATNDRSVNRAVGSEARKRGIPVSVADVSEECSFFFPALVAEGTITAAVSTGGRSPGLSRRLAGRLRGVWRNWVEEEDKSEDEGKKKL